MYRKLLLVAGAVAFLFVLIQFFRPAVENPPADPNAAFEAVAKPHPKTVAVVNRACRDCHSHNTAWPWYSRVSPVSWLIASDVQRGRAHLNFSEWNRYSPEMSRLRMKAACREAKEGKMPLRQYKLMHREAWLTAEDIDALCQASLAVPN